MESLLQRQMHDLDGHWPSCIRGKMGADCCQLLAENSLQDPSLGLNRARAGRLGRPARCFGPKYGGDLKTTGVERDPPGLNLLDGHAAVLRSLAEFVCEFDEVDEAGGSLGRLSIERPLQSWKDSSIIEPNSCGQAR